MVWPLVLRQKDACKSVCSWRQNSGWLHSQFIQFSFNGDIHIQGRHMKASFWHLLISFASVKDFWMLGLVLKLSWTLSLTWAWSPCQRSQAFYFSSDSGPLSPLASCLRALVPSHGPHGWLLVYPCSMFIHERIFPTFPGFPGLSGLLHFPSPCLGLEWLALGWVLPESTEAAQTDGKTESKGFA